MLSTRLIFRIIRIAVYAQELFGHVAVSNVLGVHANRNFLLLLSVEEDSHDPFVLFTEAPKDNIKRVNISVCVPEVFWNLRHVFVGFAEKLGPLFFVQRRPFRC